MATSTFRELLTRFVLHQAKHQYDKCKNKCLPAGTVNISRWFESMSYVHLIRKILLLSFLFLHKQGNKN